MPLLWSCADEAVLRLIRQRDPSGRGLPGARALRLLMALLHWNPGARPTPDEARRLLLMPLPCSCSQACMPGVSLLPSACPWRHSGIPATVQALRHAFFSEPLEQQRGARQGSAACSEDRSRVGWC